MRSRALCRASKVLGRGTRDPFRSRGRGSLIEILTGLLTVVSFGGFGRSTPIECIPQGCSLRLFERSDPLRPHVEDWTSLHRKRDPLLTSHVASKAPLSRSKVTGERLSITSLRRALRFTLKTRTAAREPRKGCIAYDPRCLPSYSHFETFISKFVRQFLNGQNRSASREHPFALPSSRLASAKRARIPSC